MRPDRGSRGSRPSEGPRIRHTVGVRLTQTRGRADDRGMLEDLPDDLMSRLGYRIAHGEAARLAEMAR